MSMDTNKQLNKEGIFFDEKSELYAKRLELLNPDEYAPELREQIEKINAKLKAADEYCEDLQNRVELMEYSIDSGIWSMKYDEEGKRTQIEWSDGVRKLLGYEGKEDFPDVFDSWLNVLTPEMKSTAAEVFDTVAAFEGAPALSKMDYPMRHKDGEWRWYHATGKISRRADGTIKDYIGTYRDITAEHEKDIYIQQIRTLAKLFDFVYYINLSDYSFTQFTTNDQVEGIRDEMAGENIFENFSYIADHLIAADYRQAAKDFYNPDTLQERLKKNGMDTLVIYNDKADMWYRLAFIGGNQDEDGNYTDVMFASGDITEDKRKEVESRTQANEFRNQMYQDGLTECFNRKYLNEVLMQKECQAVVMADIDHFKHVNDGFGHKCGDLAIMACADVLRSNVRGGDCVVRYGGDEFAIVFENIPLDVLEAKLERIRKEAEQLRLEEFPDLKITMSFGAVYGEGVVADQLTKADESLYKSKENRNMVTVCAE